MEPKYKKRFFKKKNKKLQQDIDLQEEQVIEDEVLDVEEAEEEEFEEESSDHEWDRVMEEQKLYASLSDEEKEEWVSITDEKFGVIFKRKKELEAYNLLVENGGLGYIRKRINITKEDRIVKEDLRLIYDFGYHYRDRVLSKSELNAWYFDIPYYTDKDVKWYIDNRDNQEEFSELETLMFVEMTRRIWLAHTRVLAQLVRKFLSTYNRSNQQHLYEEMFAVTSGSLLACLRRYNIHAYQGGDYSFSKWLLSTAWYDMLTYLGKYEQIIRLSVQQRRINKIIYDVKDYYFNKSWNKKSIYTTDFRQQLYEDVKWYRQSILEDSYEALKLYFVEQRGRVNYSYEEFMITYKYMTASPSSLVQFIADVEHDQISRVFNDKGVIYDDIFNKDKAYIMRKAFNSIGEGKYRKIIYMRYGSIENLLLNISLASMSLAKCIVLNGDFSITEKVMKRRIKNYRREFIEKEYELIEEIYGEGSWVKFLEWVPPRNQNHESGFAWNKFLTLGEEWWLSNKKEILRIANNRDVSSGDRKRMMIAWWEDNVGE